MLGRAYGLETVALRYLNVYGPRQALANPYTGVAAIFAARVLNGRRPRVFEDGGQIRDLVHVSDVVAATRAAMDAPDAPGHAINVATGAGAHRACWPAPLARALGSDLEPEVTGESRAGDIRHCFADITAPGAARLRGRPELAGGCRSWPSGSRPAGRGARRRGAGGAARTRPGRLSASRLWARVGVRIVRELHPFNPAPATRKPASRQAGFRLDRPSQRCNLKRKVPLWWCPSAATIDQRTRSARRRRTVSGSRPPARRCADRGRHRRWRPSARRDPRRGATRAGSAVTRSGPAAFLTLCLARAPSPTCTTAVALLPIVAERRPRTRELSWSAFAVLRATRRRIVTERPAGPSTS